MKLRKSTAVTTANVTKNQRIRRSPWRRSRPKSTSARRARGVLASSRGPDALDQAIDDGRGQRRLEAGHLVLPFADALRDLLVGDLVLPFGAGQVGWPQHRPFGTIATAAR